MKIGILREEKTPQDNRVPLTPSQCRTLMEEHPDVWIAVQPCGHRCYTNEEYRYQGVALKEDLSGCDILLGVKEVPPHLFIEGKTYLFFSHTIKQQPHNQKLLRAALDKRITLIDYECLKDPKGKRIIAFGRWAGIVGAYEGLHAIGKRYGAFDVKPMNECLNFAEVQKEFAKMKFPPLKIVLTGTGRVSEGAEFLLDIVNIKKVSPRDFLYKQFDEIVYTQLESKHMFYRPGHEEFDANDYHQNPKEYKSAFYPFTKVTAVFMNGIYWDKRIPAFFTQEQMQEPDFAIKVIADITCDIAPDASVPSTLRTSVIGNAVYGYNPHTGMECAPFTGESIDVMAIDNLPNELPRDASEDFGNMLMSRVIPKLMSGDSKTIDNATITVDGKLNEPFLYLAVYAGEK